MRTKLSILLTALCLIGLGCIFGKLSLNQANWMPREDILRAVTLAAACSLVVGVNLAGWSRSNSEIPQASVAKCWLPEVVGIEFATDLLPEVNRRQREILDACSAIRQQQGISSPVVRLRDDPLLASRSYSISIHGIRVYGVTLDPTEDLETHLLMVLPAVWNQHADAIEMFADLRSRAA